MSSVIEFGESLQEQANSICHERHLGIVKPSSSCNQGNSFQELTRAWKEKVLAAYLARPVPTVPNMNL